MFDKLIRETILSQIEFTAAGQFCNGCELVDTCGNDELFCLNFIKACLPGGDDV